MYIHAQYIILFINVLFKNFRKNVRKQLCEQIFLVFFKQKYKKKCEIKRYYLYHESHVVRNVSFNSSYILVP